MYSLYLKPKATKDFDALNAKLQKRILDALETLRQNPFVGKKLQGAHEGAWSLRVWPYRIVYTIQRKIVLVTVLRIVHRQEAYHK